MSSLNKVILIGRMGKDPEVKSVGSEGTKVAEVSLATTEKFTKKSGEKVENTQWHRVIFWSPLAEIVEKYVKKGALISIVGKLEYRNYDDKDGVKRYVTEIKAVELVMLGDKSDASASSEQPNAASSPQQPASNVDAHDDLPF